MKKKIYSTIPKETNPSPNVVNNPHINRLITLNPFNRFLFLFSPKLEMIWAQCKRFCENECAHLNYETTTIGTIEQLTYYMHTLCLQQRCHFENQILSKTETRLEYNISISHVHPFFRRVFFSFFCSSKRVSQTLDEVCGVCVCVLIWLYSKSFLLKIYSWKILFLFICKQFYEKISELNQKTHVLRLVKRHYLNVVRPEGIQNRHCHGKR